MSILKPQHKGDCCVWPYYAKCEDHNLSKKANEFSMPFILIIYVPEGPIQSGPIGYAHS